MERASKTFTYFGFAKRARKLLLGANTVSAYRGRVYLVAACGGASENALKEARKFAEKFHCPLIVTAGCELGDIVLKDNCRIAAVADENLARAIYDNVDGCFKVLIGRA